MSTASEASRWTRWILAAGLCVWVVSAVIGWATAAPLGHDEAQYAVSAKDMLAGREPRWFYLSRGMAFVAVPGVLAGGSELAMHVVPLLLGIAFVVAAWLLARGLFGAVTAAWVVLLLAASRYHVRHSSELLSDLPAAGLLIGAAALIVGELGRDAVRWRVVVIAPLFAGAFYVRYGSVVPIAMMCAAWLALGSRAMVRRPWPIVMALVGFLVLLIPHLVEAIRLTGSPFGIVLDSGGAASDLRTDDGWLLPYLAIDPFRNYGALIVPVLVAGLLVWFVPEARRDRRVWFVWTVSLSSIVVLGWIGIMQPRYIMFGLTLMLIVGVEVVRRLVARRPPPQRMAFVVVALAAISIASSAIVSRQLRHGMHRARSMVAELAAAHAIRFDRERSSAGGEQIGCVVATDSYTQLEWYTGCAAEGFAGYDPFARGEPFYVVSIVADGRPPPANNAAEQHTTLLVIPGVVTVTRVTRGASSRR